jgi:long-chain acyl-CoA synthetase
VILSHGNICSNINAIHSIFTFESTDRSLSFLPWAHSFGQTCELHGLLSMGASMAINDEIPNLLPNLATVQPTILFAVPRIFNRVYDNLNKQMAERPAFIRNLFYRAVAARTKLAKGESIGIGDRLAVLVADRLVFTKVRERLGGRLKYAPVTVFLLRLAVVGGWVTAQRTHVPGSSGSSRWCSESSACEEGARRAAPDDRAR